jgi:hypothetical protein
MRPEPELGVDNRNNGHHTLALQATEEAADHQATEALAGDAVRNNKYGTRAVTSEGPKGHYLLARHV